MQSIVETEQIADAKLIESSTEKIVPVPGPKRPIFSLTFAGKREITISSHELVNELSDETRFCKIVTSGVETMRAAAGDGLFTAQHNNRTWGVAHRILMPVFGPLKIRTMFDEMNDIAEQLCLKWARLGPSTPLEAADDFTRLTLDTIALCSMDFRFNSFYRDKKTHPFVESMVDVLAEADLQAVLPDILSLLRPRAMSKFRKNIEQMQSTCREIIAQRRQSCSTNQPNDLLDAMLNGRDPETGESLSEQDVVHNIITFLVAGHETTSGLLSFVIYYLLENPEELKKAREEVDRVIGCGPINVHHLQQLPFLDSVFRETLRLMPTAPGYYVTPFKEEIIGGKYAVKPGEALCILLHTLHRDPAIWGSDADDFKPDRMKTLDDIPSNAWKPFGNGMRGCIGRAFAWQEAQLVISMILRNFDISKDDQSYKLKVKHLLTIKPAVFKIRVRLRDDKRPTDFLKSLRAVSATVGTPPRPAVLLGDSGLNPMTVLYGSDAGTCEALAHRIAVEAGARGFNPNVLPMNDATGCLPKDHPVVIVSASYNGLPSRNATKFVSWIQSLQPGDLQNVHYAVYACGHRDWPSTLFKVPKAVDEAIATAGGDRLCPLGTTDTATADAISELESWLVKHLWPALSKTLGASLKKYDTDIGLKVTPQTPQRDSLREGFVAATVGEIRVLSSEGVPQKRHLELKLPAEVNYDAGGHLQVLPMNDRHLVERVLSRFGLSSDEVVTAPSVSGRLLHLPIKFPVTAWNLFASCVELTHTATPGNIQTMVEAAVLEETRTALRSMLKLNNHIKRSSVFDLLDMFPDVELHLSTFLTMLPRMRPRTYSFSSSPSWKPGYATLTYTVEEKGVASNYLASLDQGSSILHVSVRPSTEHFCLPNTTVQETTPLIMIATGTGLAPFRGFIQERALSIRQGKRLAPALLFFGCHGHELDDIYRAELESFERNGVVTVFRAFSQDADVTCKHVTDQLRNHQVDVCELWNAGANVYMCGAKKVSDSVFEVLSPMLFEYDRHLGKNGAVGGFSAWMDDLPKSRYVIEIFN
ncbi:FUM6p [Colletotrichum tofieldiae]|uniref:Bifunctional cytochrome P450/NADPH--P450 reductase n=1 Tax=Colletotrichum tofieldiae TaxID=708197 RepID=A0A166SPW0_9PEZI|nr:FUM6p [Colletotrichum tofieldiae]